VEVCAIQRCLGLFPSKVWFHGRSKEHPKGIPGLAGKSLATLKISNSVTSATINLVKKALDLGCAVSLEQPRGSLMWRFPQLDRLLCDTDHEVNDLDFCRYGKPYKKSTRIVAWNIDIGIISRKCAHPRGHRHVCLSGWRDRKNPSIQLLPTVGAAAYPEQLCSIWAKAVKCALSQ
jgi:hypothetical protein